MTRHVTTMTIYDVDHYSDAEREKIIASYPAHQRDARAKGIPTLGSGRIFPVEEESIKIAAFPIPAHWAQINGLDFGWDHPSAAARLAWDRDNDVIYVTAVHRAAQQTPVLFAPAVKAWGEWIPCAWPHDGLQHDKGSGEELAGQYRAAGLNMLEERATWEDGSNGVEAGVLEMLDRMQTGRFKVFSHLEEFFDEFRLYHRKDGKIVKLMDDILSACLHPETEVITSEGVRAIADLVGTSGLVLSTEGRWQPYKNCRLTRADAEVVRVVFSDGHDIVCTPDHKLLTDSGEWVPAIDAEGIICHDAVSRSGDKQWMKFGLTENDLPSSVTTGVDRESSCTERFGKKLTDQYQRVVTSITKTATGKTTTLGILRSRTGEGTSLITKRGTHGILFGRMPRRSGGESLKKVGRSCLKWVSEISTTCGSMLSLFANAVEKVLSLTTPEATGSAQTHVNQNGVETLVPTMFILSANSAELNSKQTSTQRPNTVQRGVRENSGYQQKMGEIISKTLRVQSVKPAGRSDVFCMEVENTHAFAVANGVIVHNCRYAIMMKREARVAPREERRERKRDRNWKTA